MISIIVTLLDKLVINRVARDDDFLNEAIDKACTFFKCGILPKLVAKWHTRLPTSTVEESLASTSTDLPEFNSNAEERWCYCKKPESGKMIMSEEDNCKIVCFLFKCLKISIAPKMKWFCPDCRRKINTSTTNRKTSVNHTTQGLPTQSKTIMYLHLIHEKS